MDIADTLGVSGVTTLSSDASVSGEFVATMPHGTFLSLATQGITNVANAQAIALDASDDVTRLTHSTVTNNSRITAQEAGSYEITFSGIADLANLPGDKHLEVWLAIDGTYVPNSNTRVQIQNANQESTVAVAFIFDLEAGSYVELFTWGDDTDCQWLYTAAGTTPTRPAVPSVIVSMKKISAYSL